GVGAAWGGGGGGGGVGTGAGGVTCRQPTSHPASRQPATHPRLMTVARIAASILLAAFASACGPRPLLREAIRARGGPLHAFVREVETDVHLEFPGRWRLRVAHLEPDHYAWTVFTAGGPAPSLFDSPP